MTQPRTGQVMTPKFMGGAVPVIPPGKDRREVLADWLASADNPFFAKSVVNRIWYHLSGKGIVDPVDDFRDSNPSANDELLDALAKDFAASKFDVKHLIRVIMNSRTYQLSAQANDFNQDDNKYFSHAVTKLLTAEQLLDAICTVTEVPEKFTGPAAGHAGRAAARRRRQPPVPQDVRPAGPRVGLRVRARERQQPRPGAAAHQRPDGQREAAQRRQPHRPAAQAKTSDAEMLDDLYLSTLSRPPSETEMKMSLEHVAQATDKRKAWEDVHWALLNTKEFLFRH